MIIKLLIVLSVIHMLQSCSALTKRAYEYPVSDIMFIHDDPKVGDYVVYADVSSYLNKYVPVTRLEVYDVSDSGVTVRYKVYYRDPELNASSPKEWYYRFIDHDGKVLKAWTENSEGQVFVSPIAMTGEMGSLEHLTKVHQTVVNPVKTRAGMFSADDIFTYIYRMDGGLVSTNTTCIEIHSDDIPFRRVSQECVTSADYSAFLTTLEYIQEIGRSYLSGSYLNVYNKATSGNASYQTSPGVVEFGFAK